jgi:hypothetical protein
MAGQKSLSSRGGQYCLNIEKQKRFHRVDHVRLTKSNNGFIKFTPKNFLRGIDLYS